MLEYLKIENVALIKKLEINFSRGFNVILGETGAGKSIIIDALNFVLGEKADKTLIRAGEEMMRVSVKFSTSNKKIFNLLCDLGIEIEGNEILLTRNYSQSGKGDARINGEIITISMLKEIASILVDAYSQNEGVALLKQKNHLEILDSYKPFEMKELKENIQEQIDKLNIINKEMKELGGSEDNRAREIDILKFQINEIENANIVIKEDEELNIVLSRMSNAEKITTNLGQVDEALNNEQIGICNVLKSAIHSLTNIESYDSKIGEIYARLQSVSIELDDCAESIFRIGNDYNFDEQTLDRLIKRRDQLDNLKKKYGGSLESVDDFLEDAKNRLEKLENAEILLKNKEDEKNKLLDETVKNMNLLSEKRKVFAKEIEGKIESGLAELGILKAKFKVNFFPLTDSIYKVSSYNINCMEDVEFLFSANFGEELKPLAKTISGGEMSRFMLVFKNVIAEVGGADTLIFDEIDSGISGQIANAVALKIAKLSRKYQILCITHLAQVAGMGDSFYYVEKGESGDRTETTISLLTENRIVEELSLLAYGKTDNSRLEVTKDMLEQNKKVKSTI